MSFESPAHFVLYVVIYSAVFIASVMLTIRESFKVSWFECFKNAGAAWVSCIALNVLLLFGLRLLGLVFGIVISATA